MAGLAHHKQPYAHASPPRKTFLEVRDEDGAEERTARGAKRRGIALQILHFLSLCSYYFRHNF